MKEELNEMLTGMLNNARYNVMVEISNNNNDSFARAYNGGIIDTCNKIMEKLASKEKKEEKAFIEPVKVNCNACNFFPSGLFY